MTPEEETIEQAIELLEEGQNGGGALLTKGQCELLLIHIKEQFSDGCSCGANNAGGW